MISRQSVINDLKKQTIMQNITIAGVPEHFNLPWHLAIANGDFEKENINLEWTDVPEGTGKMCQMLREESTDIAVILTEGIVKDIVAGNPSKIVQVYVQTPLIWGIHVGAKSNYHNLEDLKNIEPIYLTTLFTSYSIDLILDKINEIGINNLTKEELESAIFGYKHLSFVR